jgi:hypothetical protein
MTRLLLALFGILAVTAFASRAADPPSLKGTWVRESMVGPTTGHQVILTFTDHRVSARFRSGGRDGSGNEVWITLEFEGEYARTDSGLLVGSISGLNVDCSNTPGTESLNDPFGKALTKIIGEPFCFRARVVDGAMTVTDLKVPDVKIDDEHCSREMIAGFASGKYASSPTENVPVPKLKAAKANSQNHTHLMGDILGIVWNTCTPRSLPTTKNDLPSPRYLDHYPEYFQPDPAIPLAKENNSVPSNGNSSSAVPVLVTPQPVPSTMPAPLAMAPQPMLTVMPTSMATTSPQPVPQYVSAEFVPGGFFYFRPCRVEEVITMTNQNMSGSPIVLPVTPTFVPQQMKLFYISKGPGRDYYSKIIVSSPCWLGTHAMPVTQSMQISPIDLPVHATFVPQPQLWGSDEICSTVPVVRAAALMHQAETIRPIEGTWRRFGFNDTPQELEIRVKGTCAVDNKKPVVTGANSFTNDDVGRFPSRSDTTRMGKSFNDSGNPRETVIREIDLGEAGTMQVIVRMNFENAKPMMPAPIPTMAPMRACPPETTICPTPSPLSLLPMQPSAPSPILPTAGQLLPPGSMRNQPVMPAIADAWKNSTRMEGGIMK